jgi:hypothetical protein
MHCGVPSCRYRFTPILDDGTMGYHLNFVRFPQNAAEWKYSGGIFPFCGILWPTVYRDVNLVECHTPQRAYVLCELPELPTLPR